MPENALADVEGIGRRIGDVPAFGQSPDKLVLEQELVGEIVHAPIDAPVGDAELLDHAAGGKSCVDTTDNRIGVRRLLTGAVG